ncbi:MAG TPA: protein-methionine-sulfoxide reductase catalytic subunit MsrP [Bryobacteraceae bacterium]|nr:protein-methionine-sulfoxide reductase catalytic subunit MsrP [Bryobacteraceae bacterium]
MVIRKPTDLRYSQVTPKQVYLNRRRFLAAGPAAIGALGLARMAQAGTKIEGVKKSSFSATEKPNSLQDITHYNNYYEFGTDKEDPSRNAYKLKTAPWTVRVEGAVDKPQTFDLDAINKLAPLEERIYRHRCVERWSMVIPWIGFPLSALLKQVGPTSKAKYVAFETFYDGKIMLRAEYAGIRFPYVEGLRMDEAMHPLTILAVGLYGETLPNQDGAPVRLVVPWKYGFKSIKSIVKIRLVEKEPPTTWNLSAPDEYGFYSNVNPERDHPRWSQAKERRIGEFSMRNTVKFNGYGDQVASLYSGMDLRKYY